MKVQQTSSRAPRPSMLLSPLPLGGAQKPPSWREPTATKNNTVSTGAVVASMTTLGSSTSTIPPPLDMRQMSFRAKLSDVSYRKDQKAFLTPRIPPTRIPEEDYIVEKLFLPTGRGSVFCKSDGLWHHTLFPSDKPSGRADATYLNQWITHAVEDYAKSSSHKPICDQVVDLVPILGKAMHEIVRQTMYSCEERGRLLEQVWGAYVDLFDHVLEEMRFFLKERKEQMRGAEEALEFESAECDAIHAEHPNELQLLISSLEVEFSQLSEALLKELAEKEAASRNVENATTEVNAKLQRWFPHLANMLKEVVHMNFADNEVDSDDPTILLASDLQRLVCALKPKQRFQLSLQLRKVLSLDNEEVGVDANAEKINELIAEIAEQELSIQKLHCQTQRRTFGRKASSHR
eukprot:GEMP01033871.1.p1 GENE.GEMP01033871.1~~GEMP01033871.1.p1  ORF type:complete len:405 (+),score=109.75 GEMP01033871.1:223-1437(+)